jgi:NAD(P)H-hydrate epimerase
MNKELLVSAETSLKIDELARSEWGFDTAALVEAAGRSCAASLACAYPGFFEGRRPRIAIAAGAGNNGADALVMLRYFLIAGMADSHSSAVIMSKFPNVSEKTPCSECLKSLKKMKVPIHSWDFDADEPAGSAARNKLAGAEIIIDGLAGTGIKGPIKGSAAEIINYINGLGNGEAKALPFVVSVDLPSGNSDTWKPGNPIIKANLTLCIKPQKYSLYNPAARPFAGRILPVGGVFPKELGANFEGAELLDWEQAKTFLASVKPDAYKHERGAVEIHAGKVGASGAAFMAARGAQAAGAGLVRLVADNEIYPILASRLSGIMAVPQDKVLDNGGFAPNALLLGPGWGRRADRMAMLEQGLKMEENGIPLVLDADAVFLARSFQFHGNAILTPHPAEFAAFLGLETEEVLSNSADLAIRGAKEKNAVIVLKGHVIIIAAPDGKMGIIDGMVPALAAGGSGDLLAGITAALAARMVRQGCFLGFSCAAAAASLFMAAGKALCQKPRFIDPLEIADLVADIAGAAWLPGLE